MAQPILGKVNKNYSVDSITDYFIYSNILKKTPENTRLIEFTPNNESIVLWKNRFNFDINNVQYYNHLVVVGDTVSASLNNELIAWDQKEYYEGLIPTTAFRKDYVTNGEWNLFQSYVADSLWRLHLYTEEGLSGLMLPTYFDSGEERDPHYWNINWEFDLEKYIQKQEDLKYHKNHFYYPPYERLNRMKQIDPRKIIYRNYRARTAFDPPEIKTHVFADSLLWIDTSAFHSGCIEEQLATFYHHHVAFKDAPVTNLNADQAKAYLQWKEKFHQKWLNEKDKNIVVKYRLPSNYELQAISAEKSNSMVSLPAFDLSDWRITNAEYKEFVNYTIDSIAMRLLIEEGDEGVYYTTVYDDDGNELTHNEANINWKNRLDWEKLSDFEKHLVTELYVPETELPGEKRIDARKLVYAYYPMDFEHAVKWRRSSLADTIPAKNAFNGSALVYDGFDDSLIVFKGGANSDIPCWNYPSSGREYIQTNDPIQLESIVYEANRTKSIHWFEQHIYPTIDSDFKDALKQLDENCDERYEEDETGNRTYLFEPIVDYSIVPAEYDFDSEPEASVKINFAQAQAYYYWKRKMNGYVEEHENVLIANYIPSENEWKQIQAGESIINPKKEYKLPSPSFRYSIHYYPKDVIESREIKFVSYVMGGDQKLYQQGDKFAIYSYYDVQLCEFIFDKITYDQNDDLYLVEQSGKLGKMNYKGEMIIPVEYEQIKKVDGLNYKYEVKKDGEWNTMEFRR